ncbi:unnamed protein product [Cylindrotheca closterium]|uniref:Uncharacterized protein n=1 Tax=Cylindrotheca closterium TaxID=2856 RepID=A0AAD2FPL9_9STRA|nr:unnamed protein product [Cylindrotheca closterium]
MWSSSHQRILFLILSFLVILSSTLVGAQDKPSCLDYSKGAYAGNVTSQQECRTACETAEGLPEPDFKTSTCDDGSDVNGTNYKCDCKRCDSSNANCERRQLCIDEICSSGTSKGVMMVGLMAMVVAYMMA